MRLPKGLERQFQQELAEYEAAMSNPYITSIEQHGIEKGYQQGLAQGQQKGREEGELNSLRRTLKKQLSHRRGRGFARGRR